MAEQRRGLARASGSAKVLADGGVRPHPGDPGHSRDRPRRGDRAAPVQGRGRRDFPAARSPYPRARIARLRPGDKRLETMAATATTDLAGHRALQYRRRSPRRVGVEAVPGGGLAAPAILLAGIVASCNRRSPDRAAASQVRPARGHTISGLAMLRGASRQLPVYIISLDRRPDRWTEMSEQLDRLGMEAERIPAVDATLLHKQEERERQTPVDPRHWRVGIGAAACIFSHRKALARFLESERPAALILEDDAVLATDTSGLLHSLEWWPPGAHVIRLAVPNAANANRNRGKAYLRDPSGQTPNGRQVRRIERWAGDASAYLIDREGAAMICTAPWNIGLHNDETLFHLHRSPLAQRLRPHQVFPAMARQMHPPLTDSDLEHWRARHQKRKRRRSLLRSIRFQCLRAVGTVQQLPVPYRENSCSPTPSP